MLPLKTMKPNDFGRIFLVEECQRIEMKTLLQNTKEQLKHTLLQSEVEANGVPSKILTSETGNGGRRYWFSCPECQKRKGVLFVHPLSQRVACRECLRLRYRKQAKKGMVEGNIL